MKRRFPLATGLIGGALLLYSLACLLPMVLVVVVSFTSEASLMKNGVQLFPREVSLLAYEMLLRNMGGEIGRSYYVTVASTLVGTLLALLVTTMAAYVLNDANFKARRFFSLYFFFSMLFSGGIVPWYLINRGLGLYDNFWALVVPSLLFTPYNMFLVRNYMKSLPASLMEAARIDGANEVVIAFRIFLPLCLPVLAVIALFYGMGYWNSWWNAIMLVDNRDWHPLQFMLLNVRSVLRGLEMGSVSMNVKVPGQPMQNAITLFTIGPILLLYPFLQRYFVKGIAIGAVKG